MSIKDFPEKDPEEQKPVDFSDLGPLFAPREEEPVDIPEISFQPEAPQVPVNEAAEIQEESPQEEDTSVEETPTEELPSEAELPEEEVSFQPEEAAEENLPPEVQEEIPAEEVTFEPEEAPAVDFSDLGPLFQQEGPSVVAGEAAQVLKKLSEMEPEVPEEEAEPDLQSEPSEDSVSPEEIPLEEVSSSETEEIPQEEEMPVEEVIPEEAEVQEESGLPEEAQAETASEDSEKQEEEENSAQELTVEQAPAEKPKEEASSGRRPTRKGRPKRKKGEGFFGIPNLLVTVVWIAITVLIGVTLGRMAWICAADVLAFGREDKPVTITVYEADTIEDITRKLHEGGLIKYPGLFKFYASLAVDEGEIHPGIWDLNTRYDYHALVNMMSPSSSREVIELMIPEGYSCRQIFALMEENKICTSLDLGAYAASGELDDYWFLEGVDRGDMYCLEGYLFPDTYQFYKNDSPRNVLSKMLNNFESRFDEAMVEQIDSLNDHLADLMRQGGHGEDYIAEHLFTVKDVINVASLIEKETSSADEGYVIASVIYNRLFNWPDNVPYLNIDATIVYALGGKNKLTQEDLKVNSPYNTYTHTGLTPGPIANPGLSSIRAALDPAESNYYYYVLDPALGSHRFSTTYDEHKANIASIGD